MDADEHDNLPRHQPAQLRLLDPADVPDWLLDESTRAIGRQGIEAARAALASARRRHPAPDDGRSPDDHANAA
jgi:hypothetical protein